MGSLRYCWVNLLFNIRPSSSATSNDCWSAGATGFGTQIVLKYLYNFCKKTDVQPEDMKTPSTNLTSPIGCNLTELSKEENNIDPSSLNPDVKTNTEEINKDN